MEESRQKPLSPYSIRFSEEERAWLEEELGTDGNLSDLIRYLIFEVALQKKWRRRRKSPVKDAQLLTKLLGELGKSRLANNLNQLAKSDNSGSLEDSPDTEKALQNACADVRWMRHMLMAALGVQPGDGP